MEQLGLDTDRIIAECRISPELLKDRSARFPHAAQAHFWRVLEEASGDVHIGLRIAEVVPVYRGQVLEYLFLSSSTFGDGLRRAQNYQRLVTDAMQFKLQEGAVDSQLLLEFAGEDRPGMRHRDECFARFLTRYFQALTDNRFMPKLLNFKHAPVGDPAFYQSCFGAPVAFEQSASSLVFATEILSIPSSHAEPDLLKLHERVASKQLERLSRQDVVIEVKGVIAEILELGQPSLERIAQRLNISQRLLRSRLADAGTSFNQILADYRCVLAKRLLARTEESVADVVYLTGFSEPSTFYRAFKRWTGMTPVEYRQRKKRDAQTARGHTAPE